MPDGLIVAGTATGRGCIEGQVPEAHLARYVVDVVSASRDPKAAGLPALASLIEHGASVRASLALVKVAKAQAMLAGRTYVSPHDVKTVALDVMRHRVAVSYEAEAQGKTSDHVVAQILETVPVP